MKTNIILRLAFVLAVLLKIAGTARCADTSPALKVMIDIPEIWRDGKLVVPRTLQNPYLDLKNNPWGGHFYVVVKNISSKPLVFQYSSNEGLFGFELSSEGGQTIFIPPQDWPSAATGFFHPQVAPGALMVFEIFYGGGMNQLGFPFPQDRKKANKPRTMIIRAVFERKGFPGPPADVWAGRVVSEPYKVVFLNDAP